MSAFNITTGIHAVGRVGQGFDINDVVAEFRALRAAVLRRWTEEGPAPTQQMLSELTRFHEAIDQAVAESVHAFTVRAEHSRDLFVGMISHDLRSPLNVVTMTAHVLGQAECAGEPVLMMAGIMERAAKRMEDMLDDLLVFTRARLSDNLPLRRERVGLRRLLAESADELRASFPAVDLELQFTGAHTGLWDRRRVQQIVANLLVNAARYGNGRITGSARDDGGRIILSVFNSGPPIPSELIPTLFNSLTRKQEPSDAGRAAGLGLGLFICQSIAQAHGGRDTCRIKRGRHHLSRDVANRPVRVGGGASGNGK